VRWTGSRGWISDPKSKAKSLVLSPDGLARGLFEQHFAVTVK
jgi:hypothetical protein